MFALFLRSSVLLAAFVATAQDDPQRIPLWPDGAPGFKDRRAEPELASITGFAIITIHPRS
jgi:hypothetical protein